MSNDALPFGGVGNSGMGRYHGKYTFTMFTHEKTVLKKHFILDLPARYPPYSNKFNMFLLGLLQYPYNKLQILCIKTCLLVLLTLACKKAGVLEGIVRPLLHSFFSWGASATSGSW